MIGAILTGIIGKVAKGAAAKAIAGGVSGAVLTSAEPVFNAFSKGLATGALPRVEELGVAVGSMVAGYVVGYIVTWYAPANKDAPK